MKPRNVPLHGKRILITGAAGFIGAGLAEKICNIFPDCSLIGIDNINDYYDTHLKRGRLERLKGYACFRFVKGSISDKEFVQNIFSVYRPHVVVNLAAQAGVRYSIDFPDTYIETNIVGFFNILEACRHYPVEHLVFASSSSVYGANQKVPYSEEDQADWPVSLYAATKKSDELLANAYSRLYDIPSTGLRFFTVYGPAGRPDMAYYSFSDKMVRGETIRLFNYGKCKRDFTYIDDVTEGIIKVLQAAPEKGWDERGLSVPPYAIYNIGNSHPEDLIEFVRVLREELIRAEILDKDYDLDSHMELVPMQPGDVVVTCADTESLERDFGFRPSVPLREGLRKFAEWYYEYYMRE